MSSETALLTKIRAMQRNLITADEYKALENLHTVNQLTDYLKNHPAYAPYFADLNAVHISRFEVERRLYEAFNNDFMRVYKFANLKTRKFLKAFAVDFVILYIKKNIHALYRDTPSDIDQRGLLEYFRHYSVLDPDRLADARNLTEVIESLQGTELYEPLRRIHEQHGEQLIYFETWLDNYFFARLRTQRNRTTDRENKAYLKDFYGTVMDLLNIATIYRSKKYYHLPDASIVPFLIPMNWKIDREEVNALVHAEDVAGFLEVLRKTTYGHIVDELNSDNIDTICRRYLYRKQKSLSRRMPQSVAGIGAYFFYRKQEIALLIAVTEGIRYKLSDREKLKYMEEVGKCS
ncbi:MAG: V-type ATPase subunit [Eubacteriales bacterium]|nr:V-type ATPase subunit [Eubacteriales bacterium]